MIIQICFVNFIYAFYQLKLSQEIGIDQYWHSFPVVIQKHVFSIGFQIYGKMGQWLKCDSLLKKKNYKLKNSQINEIRISAKVESDQVFNSWFNIILQSLYLQNTYEVETFMIPVKIKCKKKQDKHYDGYLDLVGNEGLLQKLNITDKMISIYFGKPYDQHLLQFGGRSDQYGKGKTYTLQMQNKLRFSAEKVMIMKQKNNGFMNTTIIKQKIDVKLNMSTKFMTIPYQAQQMFIRAFEDGSVQCKFDKHLICENLKYQKLLLMQLIIPGKLAIYIDKFFRRSEKKKNTIQFNIRVGQFFQIGRSFFQTYYTTIDFTNNKLIYQQAIKYRWSFFSWVTLLRALLLMTVISVFILLAVYIQAIRSQSSFRKIKHQNQQAAHFIKFQQL